MSCVLNRTTSVRPGPRADSVPSPVRQEARCDVEFDFSEVWSAWLAGRDIGDAKMGGLSILWWGRVGRLSQFLGGLTVVLDVIGSARLRRWARGLQYLSHAMRRPGLLGDESAMKLIWRVAISSAITMTFLGGTAFYVLLTQWSMPTLGRVTVAAFGTVIIGSASIGLLPYLAMAVLSALSLTLKAMSWLFDAPRPGHPMRWLAVALIVSGFGFDLLAS